MRKGFFSCLTSIILCAAIVPVAAADPKEDAELLIDKARIVIEEMVTSRDKVIPEDLLRDCAGLAIIPDMFKGGFIVGGSYGKGIVMAHQDGNWSSPAFTSLGAGSVGLQIGVESIDLILVIVGQKAMDSFLRTSFKLGDADKAWYSYRIADGKTFNLTGKLGVKFEDEEWDSPSEPGPYGNAGWTEGDKAFLVYDRYDIWEIAPDGTKSRMLTNGLGREREDRLPLLPPGTGTSRSSRPGLSFSQQPTTSPRPREHFASIRPKQRPTRSRSSCWTSSSAACRRPRTPKSMSTRSSASRSSLTCGSADPTLRPPARSAAPIPSRPNTTGAGPSLSSTRMPRSEAPGHLDQAEDFDPKKKYPMIVYIYETLSDVHNYSLPGRAPASTSPTTSAMAT